MAPHEELLRKIAIVRGRWKTFLWLRGMAWILGVTVASLLLGLALANSTGISGWTVTVLRFGLLAAVVATVIKALVMPLRRTPTDIQLARFVEEKNPGLEDRLVSAVDAIHKSKTEQIAFVHLLTKDALDRTKHVRFSDQVNKRKFSTFAALTAAFAIALVISLYISSLFFPVGSAKLLAFKPPNVDAYELKVTPGDITVPRGSDVTIQAVAMGFDPRRAEVHLRYANGTQWESNTMEVTPQNLPTFRHLVFNLQEPVHYFVDAGEARSKEFTIDVADLPRVEKVDYTYHYPSYTGLAVKKEENGTDIAALKGTEVEVMVTGSQALSGGRIVFADGKSVTLQPNGERSVMGKVTVDRTTTFRIELTNTARAKYLGLEEYSMEALDDQKPIVEFTKPGRDTKATKVEEVFTELRAEDDFGVRQLELYFSVNGGPEQKLDLFSSKGESPKEISAGHTFFLEEYDLQPGDLVTYYGKAVDTRNPANTVSTDIYFIEVRPFGREYRQGQQGGGGGGGGDQDDSTEALSRRQKEIIAATHKLVNNKDKFKDKEWKDNIHAIATNQTKLADQTNTVMQRMSRRGLTNQDKTIKQLSENLKNAMDQMNPAADQLKAENAVAAEPFEQKALQYLMRAEALFNEIQVTQGGGGGGGGARQSAEDLADLFELELDQNKNQYETLQRGEMNKGSQAVDEALQKLKELAERQQKLLERKRAQQQGPGGSSGDQMSAQELQKETERLARQLDKLSRENNDRQMADVSRALQQAAQNMQQQAQGGNSQQQEQAAQQALEQLNRAQRLLNQGRGGSMDERLAKLQDQAKKLKEQQGKVADEAQQLAANPGAPTDARRRAQDINQQKDGVGQELKSMTNELESLSNNQENKDAANKARAAANSIKGQQLQNKIEQGRQILDNATPQNGYFNYSAQLERAIEKGLDDVQKQIGQAASAANNSDEKKQQNALNKLSDTIQRAESMQRRLQNLQGQQGQQGQNQQGQNQQGQNQQGQNQQGQNQQGQNQQGRNQQGQSQQGQSQQAQGQGQGQGQGSQAQGQGQGQGQGSQAQGQGGARQGQPQGGYAGGLVQNGGDPTAPGDPRQWMREYQQLQTDLRDIQNGLGRNDPISRELEQINGALQNAIRDPRVGDPRAIDRLAAQIIDPLRGIELELSRNLQLLLSKENIRSAQEDEIPQGYQKLVEEYYKKLSNPKQQN